MKIENLGNDVSNVTVSGSITTQHKVTVTDDIHQSVLDNLAIKEDPLELAFNFFLDREPNPSILKFYDTIVIQSGCKDFRRA